MAEKRNKIVFKDLKQQLLARNKIKGTETWRAAMETCYACHQGNDSVKVYRKYVPNQGEHSYHQVIVKKMGFNCNTCHYGNTARVGYDK